MKTRILIDEENLKGMIGIILNEILYNGLPKQDRSGDVYWAALSGSPYILEEGLIKSYPIKDVISSISGLFDLYEVHDIIERNRVLYELDNSEDSEYTGTIECSEGKNNTQIIELKFKEKSFNQSDFDKYFLKYGWFCSHSEKLFGYANMVRLAYEKKFDVEVTDAVLKKKYIYHICPNVYLNRINHSGLKPKFSSWNVFSNPERLYFFLTELSHDDFLKWVRHFRNGKRVRNSNDGWSLLKIDVSELTNNPVFYFDPRMKNGIYTMDSISPENIEIIDYIND